jgi:hypothetical protein
VSSFIRSIGIHISLTSIGDPSGSRSSGLRADIQVSSFYRLTSPSNPEQMNPNIANDIIEIIYRNNLILEIDPRNSSLSSWRNFESSDFLHGSLIFKSLDPK